MSLYLSPGNSGDDQERFFAVAYGLGQWRIREVMGHIVPARKESHQGPDLLCDLIANCSAQRGVDGFERIENRSPRYRTLNVELYLAASAREYAQMRRHYDSYHGNVRISTDSTPGRSRTMAAQWSPESADAYTWPPLVPK